MEQAAWGHSVAGFTPTQTKARRNQFKSWHHLCCSLSVLILIQLDAQKKSLCSNGTHLISMVHSTGPCMHSYAAGFQIPHIML